MYRHEVRLAVAWFFLADWLGTRDISRHGRVYRKDIRRMEEAEERGVSGSSSWLYIANSPDIRNIQLTDFKLQNSRFVFDIGQCTSYNFQTGSCDTSTIEISNVTVGPIKGTVASDPKNISLQCSSAAPCSEIRIDLDVTWKDKAVESTFTCSNQVDPMGFTCG